MAGGDLSVVAYQGRFNTFSLGKRTAGVVTCSGAVCGDQLHSRLIFGRFTRVLLGGSYLGRFDAPF